jgi:hypothetical protein
MPTPLEVRAQLGVYHMAEPGEYRFEIADMTPLTLSMSRLDDYIPHLIDLFGHEDNIHLMRVDDGSAVPCILAKNHVVKSVQKRLLKIKTGAGSRKAYQAVECLNDLLAEDHTSAVLKAPYYGLEIVFPGVRQATDPVVGPVSEYCDIQGELIQIGGRDETISLYIKDGRNILICTATREQGRDVSTHLFRQVRVSGTGKWIRNQSGRWRLLELIFGSLVPLQHEPLSTSIQSLRTLSESIEGERIQIESE